MRNVVSLLNPPQRDVEIYCLCLFLPYPQDPLHALFGAPSCAHFGQPGGRLGFAAAIAIHELL